MNEYPAEADKRGYLVEDFRLFHLRDSRSQRIAYHYHEFDKVVVFLAGQVTYTVEGRAYFMSEGDILLVPHHQIHQPEIGASTYDRMVLWLSPDFLEETGLNPCFRTAADTGFHLLRGQRETLRPLLELLEQMKAAGEGKEFGAEIMERACCLQFLVLLNRLAQGELAHPRQETYRSDPKIDTVMAHINANLTAELTVQGLAEECYLSPSWLMHRFKEVTGCTVHQYILQKRLILAGSMIRAGTPVMKAAAQSGFSDYSTFLRAFQSTYHCSPRELAGAVCNKR